jgi:hypothetical protein
MEEKKKPESFLIIARHNNFEPALFSKETVYLLHLVPPILGLH